MLTDKTILITGGTGSLGQTLVRRIMGGEMGEPKKIIIFSRDEAKHHKMKVEWKQMQTATDDVFYGNFEEVLDFRIGDVRDYDSVVRGIKESNIVINAAALKQVPICEYFPFEAVKTNIIGAQNIVRSIRENAPHIELVVDVSTDKACKPINTYGMTKAIQERIFLEANYSCRATRFVCVRYGNVIASTGSVIPLFRNQIKNGGPITITIADMTRFIMTLDKAADTIFETMRSGQRGETYIPIVPSTRVMDLAEAMIDGRDIKIEFIGIRPGEKIHEILVSEEEVNRTYKRNGYYIIRSILPEVRKSKINKKALDKELSSEHYILDKEQLKEVLVKEGHLQIPNSNSTR